MSLALRRRSPRRVPAPLWVVLAVLPAAAGPARAQTLAGTWTESEHTMNVTITSWGSDCPPAPQSSSTHPNTGVAVDVQGDQLVFPHGRQTDRCWSDNSALRRTRFSKQGDKWIVECETAPDDARQEHGRYVVTAEPARIVIDADSHYDWTLRQDHCAAEIVERRVLTRAAPAPTDAGVAEADADAGARDAAAAADSFPRIDAGSLLPLPPPHQEAPRPCAQPGAPARLRIRAVQTVQPGGRVPVSVHQVDAQGCDLGPVAATYDIVGASRGCRIGADGIFQACDSVAQCDGETVRIRVSSGGLSGQADIRISARIEQGLGTVEPVWIDEPSAGTAAAPSGGSQVAASLQAQAQAGGSTTPGSAPSPGAAPAGGAVPPAAGAPVEEGSSLALWLVVGGGGAIVLAVIIYLVAGGRRKRKRSRASTVDDLAALREAGSAAPAAPFVVAAAPPPAVPAPPAAAVRLPPPTAMPAPGTAPPSPPRRPTWHCPACRREHTAAGYCPADGLALVDGPPPGGPRTVIYLACPKCGRGYGPETKFCPMERELLLPYGLGMNAFRASQKGRPEPPERVCPRCGARAPGADRFCARDGETLVPQR